MGFPVPGGSVLVCCTLDDIATEPHGYVREYHLYQALIRQQLAQMYANGQRRLGIAIPYYEGADTFALDSTHGELTLQDEQNLRDLIADATAAGFSDFVIEMIPEWTASYENWLKPEVMGKANVRAWQPLIYSMCLAFTLAVDQVMALTGATYYMDLCAECEHTQFGSRLWTDWCALKGPVGLGFSMVSAQRVINLLPNLYTNGLEPSAVSLHWYPGDEMPWTAFKKAFRAAGHPQGFVLGETNTNDGPTAAALAADKADLFWLLQWPVLGGVTPPNVAQDRLTLEYSHYSAAGL